MLSIDTNILLYAAESANPLHTRAAAFLADVDQREDVALSEFTLIELYVVLRNPVVIPRPFTPTQAVAVCQALRGHPRWQVLGFPRDSAAFHDAFWPWLAAVEFARRRAYDWRLALTLLRQGVDEFATANVRDFEAFGFRHVWNPLAER